MWKATILMFDYLVYRMQSILNVQYPNLNNSQLDWSSKIYRLQQKTSLYHIHQWYINLCYYYTSIQNRSTLFFRSHSQNRSHPTPKYKLCYLLNVLQSTLHKLIVKDLIETCCWMHKLIKLWWKDAVFLLKIWHEWLLFWEWLLKNRVLLFWIPVYHQKDKLTGDSPKWKLTVQSQFCWKFPAISDYRFRPPSFCWIEKQNINQSTKKLWIITDTAFNKQIDMTTIRHN